MAAGDQHRPPPAYPRRAAQEGRPEGPWRHGRRRWVLAGLVGAGIFTGVAGLIGLWYAFLWAVNPVGDEWVCSDGEAPAGSACYPVGEPLPAGLTWDPLGNRPMSYNCDKRGWTPIARDDGEGRDCLNDGLPVPAGWHVVDD